MPSWPRMARKSSISPCPPSPLSRSRFIAAGRSAPEAVARRAKARCQSRRRVAPFIRKNQTRGDDHMRLVIIGAGFAGMYAALSAARLRDIKGVSPEALEIALVAPEPTLVVRPRLYEPKPETLTAPLLDVLK